MFNWLKEPIRVDERLTHLESICAARFRETYPDKQLLGWCMIAKETDDYLIVRLCFERGRPPGRTFWKVEKQGNGYGSIEDVTERASDFVTLDGWR